MTYQPNSTEFDSLQTGSAPPEASICAHSATSPGEHDALSVKKMCKSPCPTIDCSDWSGGESICFAMSQESAFASRYEFLTRTQSQLFRRNWVLTCFNLVPNSSPPCATKGVCLRQGSYYCRGTYRKWKGFGVCVCCSLGWLCRYCQWLVWCKIMTASQYILCMRVERPTVCLPWKWRVKLLPRSKAARYWISPVLSACHAKHQKCQQVW